MPNEIISEGRTTTEAIEKGLKELKVSKDKVEITVLESEDKRSFFSILAPRVVKVKLTLKENQKTNHKKEYTKKEPEERKEEKLYVVSKEEVEQAKVKADSFLQEFIRALNNKQIDYQIQVEDSILKITFEGEDASEFIGYRGEVLNALQTIISTIANKQSKDKVKVILDIANYKEKREKTLEDLAVKVSKSVMRTGKAITLEPMTAYERKIIHSKLQGNNKITTYSVGEEPHRKIVIAKK